MTFEEWIIENHPEFYDEGWRDWAKKAALGGALVGAGLGIGQQMGGQPTTPTQSPAAVQDVEQPGDIQKPGGGEVLQQGQGIHGEFQITKKGDHIVIMASNPKGSFDAWANQQFMNHTGSDMQGVQHGTKEVKGWTGKWFKIPSQEDIGAARNIGQEMGR
jgi:hypothetical protein